MIVIDTETTGLDPTIDLPWEIAFMELGADFVQGPIHVLNLPVTQEAFDRAMAAAEALIGTEKEGLFSRFFEAVDARKVDILSAHQVGAQTGLALRSLEAFAVGTSERPVWAGINPMFDARMLYREPGTWEASPWWHTPVDLKIWALGELGIVPATSEAVGTDDLLERLGISVPNRHSAAGDVLMTARLAEVAHATGKPWRDLQRFMGEVRPGIDTVACSALAYAALGVGGEAGELVDAIKKSTRVGAKWAEHRQQIVLESGDLLFYLMRVLQEASVDLAEVIEANEAKRRSRGLLEPRP